MFGGWLPSLIRLTHTRMQLMMSFVAGLMLGVALLHLLPHAHAELQSLDVAVGWTLAGLLVMFFLIRIFQFHQHGPVAEVASAQPGDVAGAESSKPQPSQIANHSHGDVREHAHDHNQGEFPRHSHTHTHSHSHSFGWAGLTLGLALHTMIDGVALAASVQVEAAHRAGFALLGLGTFLAIALHKPLDALSISTLMAAAGWAPRRRLLVSAGFGAMCPLGAALFWFGTSRLTDQQHPAVGCALAFSAGVFLCISLGDLLPEVHFHTHDKVKLSALLLLGILVAFLIGLLPGHSHLHAPRQSPVLEHDHDHDHDQDHEH
jgi:zinc and cadmium transporter